MVNKEEKAHLIDVCDDSVERAVGFEAARGWVVGAGEQHPQCGQHVVDALAACEREAAREISAREPNQGGEHGHLVSLYVYHQV